MESYSDKKLAKLLKKLNNECLNKHSPNFYSWTSEHIWEGGYRFYCYECELDYQLCNACETILSKHEFSLESIMSFVGEVKILRQEIVEMKKNIDQISDELEITKVQLNSKQNKIAC